MEEDGMAELLRFELVFVFEESSFEEE